MHLHAGMDNGGQKKTAPETEGRLEERAGLGEFSARASRNPRTDGQGEESLGGLDRARCGGKVRRGAMAVIRHKKGKIGDGTKAGGETGSVGAAWVGTVRG